MIRIGITMIVICSAYLVAGLFGWAPIEVERLAWNNLRIVSGGAILGCLLAGVGYGNE